MTTLNVQLDKEQKMAHGKLTQAKGVVREQLGNLQNDELMRLAGKKDQMVGQLQANYGDSWVVRHSGWVLLGTAVAFVSAVLALRFTRSGDDTN